MPQELLAVSAQVWMVVAVAGVGIAALPWTAVEVSEVTGAIASARRLLSVGVRVVRRESVVEGLAPALAR